jgi:hypothetical protein
MAETAPAAAKRVVMIHTVKSNTEAFGKLASELLPGVDVEHVVDESLLQDTIRRGELTEEVRARFAERVSEARLGSPDAILFTCSSVGPAADGLGVQRIDQAMAERAVSMGTRIGVAATLPTTLGPTSDLIRSAADRAGAAVEVRSELAEGAFALLTSGNGDDHDARVRAALQRLAEWADVIVLAQASMVRATGGADAVESGGRRVPLLSSPRLGMDRLRETLGIEAG